MAGAAALWLVLDKPCEWSSHLNDVVISAETNAWSGAYAACDAQELRSTQSAMPFT